MRIGYARPSVLEPDAAPQVKALQDEGDDVRGFKSPARRPLSRRQE